MDEVREKAWHNIRRVVPFPVNKVIDLCAHNLEHQRTSREIMPHIIRDDTDVRIIEREDSPRRPRVAYPADPPTPRRTHPAARKAMPVRMQIFVHFTFCHPSGRPASRRAVRISACWCKRALQRDYAVTLKCIMVHEIIPVNVIIICEANR